jgi:diguanylate cyclase (GGDEF)-like protein
LGKRLAHGERLALAMIDLDGFKAINDNFGHAVGDRLIKATAEVLEGLVGDRGMVARLGGDEFAILLSGNHCVTRLETVAQDTLARLSQPFRIDERTVVVGASIGLVSASLHDYDTSEFMRRADVAMYAAKRAGKMRIYWYDELLDQRRAKAQTIEIELRAAIENEVFELVYQPIVDAVDKSVVGVEALLRWNSPTRGDVGPAEFIPVAEETGLIDRIGLIALRRVCTDGMMWPDVDVSINVSSSQLRNPDFVGNLATVLTQTGFPANRLILEITETYLLYDPETALGVVRALKSMGVGIALDDYGTGCASIGFLQRFMFDRIKIDGQMIVDAYRTDSGLVLLNAVVATTRALGMSICAEGIETEAQAELMRVAGCEQLQGWHYARPMPADEITRTAVRQREAA